MFNKKLKKEIAKINEQLEILARANEELNREYLTDIVKLQATINSQKNTILKFTECLHPHGIITVDKKFSVQKSISCAYFEKSLSKYFLEKIYQKVWLVNLNDTYYRFDATNLPADFPERIAKIENNKIIMKNNEEWFIDFKENKIKPITPINLFSQTLRNLNKYER